MSKRRISRMGRNIELGDGCRTVFLPTVMDLAEWWTQNRARCPVMAYYTQWLDMLPSCRDANEECEFVVGPTVEAVVAVMLCHLRISTEAVWTEGHWDGADW